MNLASISSPKGVRKRRRRVGRGMAAGQGKTCGRGTKGEKARGSVTPAFEGGQARLYRRLPHLRGKTNKAMNIGIFRKELAIVNVSQLQRLDPGTEVTPETVKALGLVKGLRDGLKVLGNGELDRPLTVRAHRVSAAAQQKIEAAGGTVEVIAR